MNEHVSAWQRIGDSNKLWIASVLMVVVLTAAFVKMSSRTIARVAPAPPPRDAPSYFKNYQRYSDFASQFVHDKKFSDEIISARFVTPGRFKIVVPATVSADAVDYMSKMAAEQVRHEFQHKTIVLVYVRSAASRNLTLVATTQWKVKSKAEKSGYVVRLHDAASKVL